MVQLGAAVPSGGDMPQYEVHIEEDSSDKDFQYVGEAEPGSVDSAAVWRIKRIEDTASKGIHIEWANGNADFTNIWNDRESLSYS